MTNYGIIFVKIIEYREKWKNIKKTLTILLCYIFVVMIMITNVIVKAIQSISTNEPDYSTTIEK